MSDCSFTQRVFWISTEVGTALLSCYKTAPIPLWALCVCCCCCFLGGVCVRACVWVYVTMCACVCACMCVCACVCVCLCACVRASVCMLFGFVSFLMFCLNFDIVLKRYKHAVAAWTFRRSLRPALAITIWPSSRHSLAARAVWGAGARRPPAPCCWPRPCYAPASVTSRASSPSPWRPSGRRPTPVLSTATSGRGELSLLTTVWEWPF